MWALLIFPPFATSLVSVIVFLILLFLYFVLALIDLALNGEIKSESLTVAISFALNPALNDSKKIAVFLICCGVQMKVFRTAFCSILVSIGACPCLAI